MSKNEFSLRKASLYALLFQLFPALCIGLRLCSNRPMTPKALIGIIFISELILAVLLINWRQRSGSDVVDEREIMIRLQVRVLVSRVHEVSFIITCLAFFSVYKNMPTLLALLLPTIPALLTEVYANIFYRRSA